MATKNSPSTVNQILKKVPYFSALDEAALNLVSQETIRRVYEPEQVVLIEGEPCVGLHIIESGWVKAIKIGYDGREQVLQTLGPGETFNALSVFTGAPNQATVTALEKSTLWLVTRAAMLRLLDENPHIARLLVQDLAEKIQYLVRLVEDLSLRSVEARLARLLLEQAKGEALKRHRWATQAEMAARLGTVPDVLNRALRKLVEDGLIQVARHQIQILDRQGLEAKAELG